MDFEKHPNEGKDSVKIARKKRFLPIRPVSSKTVWVI